MKINNSYGRIPEPIRPADTQKTGHSNAAAQIGGKTANHSSFAHILQEMLPQQSELKFSAHAQKRLQDRQINLAADDLQKIDQAMTSAEKKGARSTLMLYQDLALIANVNNKTVITAMSGEDMQEHIFTNIDSAVIIKN